MLILGKSQAFKTSSAMAADASALWWYDPDSVVRSGSTITSWDDKTSAGYDLAQVDANTLPTYNTGGDYVAFTGSEVIGLATRPYANGLSSVLDGGGAVAIFAVAFLDPDPQGGIENQVLMAEGDVPTQVPTDGINLYCQSRDLGVNTDIRFRSVSSLGGAFFPTTARNATNTTALATACLIECYCDQSTASVDLAAGTDSASEAPTVANFPTTGDGFYLGAGANGGVNWIGGIYEVFATSDASTANRNAIRAELNAKYGL